jgi:hypothetical protein
MTDPTPGPPQESAELPDSGMMTGSDEGAPGERLPSGPLDADDEATLRALQESDGDATSAAVEESEAAVRAVEDDAPLPPAGGAGGSNGSGGSGGSDETDPDPDTPVFVEPTS